MTRYRKKSQAVMSGSRGERGGRSIKSRSGGLNPSAVAGRPSVTRFTQRSCTGISTSGIPNAAVRKMLHYMDLEELTKIEYDLLHIN